MTPDLPYGSDTIVIPFTFEPDRTPAPPQPSQQQSGRQPGQQPRPRPPSPAPAAEEG